MWEPTKPDKVPNRGTGCWIARKPHNESDRSSAPRRKDEEEEKEG